MPTFLAGAMPNEHHDFGLVAFDMDGVLVDYESSWTWVHDHFGVRSEESINAFIKGEIDDMEFMRRDIALWLGKKPDLCRSDIDAILEPLPIVEGIQRTVDELKWQGIRTVIVSGGLDVVASKIAKRYGFDDWMANGFACDTTGRLTGEGVLRVELSNKRQAVERFSSLYGIDREHVCSVGNSFIDVSMFEASKLKIAFNPIDDYVAHQANVVVRSHDLSDVLPYILGQSSGLKG
jgi:phosphoserine phosphatase